jgi:hypothetical protein
MTVTIEAAAVAAALLVHAGTTTAVPGRGLAVAALSTWIVDAVSGAYMLATWISRGGLRRQRASDRLAPRVVFTHFGLASTGLLVWISFLVTRWIVLAWLAVGALMLVIGLGISTVTLWTPFPAHRGGEADAPAGADAAQEATAAEGGLTGRVTDEMLARALTDEALLARLVDNVVASVPADPSRPERKPRPHLATIVPAGHGLAAIATFLLALLTAASTTR